MRHHRTTKKLTMRHERCGTLRFVDKRMGKPTASAERNASVRAIVKAIIEADFGGTKSKAAAKLGLTKAGLGKFLAGHTGYGERLRNALAGYLLVPFDEIVAANGDLAALRSRKATRRTSVELRFGDLPGWESLVAGAKAIEPAVPAWAWDELRDARVWVSQTVTTVMVADAGRFILRHVPPPHGPADSAE